VPAQKINARSWNVERKLAAVEQTEDVLNSKQATRHRSRAI
jgi:hypothetical protein